MYRCWLFLVILELDIPSSPSYFITHKHARYMQKANGVSTTWQPFLLWENYSSHGGEFGLIGSLFDIHLNVKMCPNQPDLTLDDLLCTLTSFIHVFYRSSYQFLTKTHTRLFSTFHPLHYMFCVTNVHHNMF